MYQGAIMAHMLQHSWLKCYYTIAVIKLTKATSHWKHSLVVRSIACLHSPPNPAITPPIKRQ